jgi:sigma-B regulation protein RsbU (phosphoserine phosphatase)
VGHLVTWANRVLAADLRKGEFITLMYVSYDPQTRTISYVGAGQQCYLLDAGGEVKRVLESTNPPINTQPNLLYSPGETLSAEAGDLLVQFTDGITTSRSPEGEAFGAERALEVVRACRDMSARSIVEMLFSAVADFTHRQQSADDVTAVVARF